MTTTVPVELRCPIGPKRLLGIMHIEQEHPRVVAGNLLELSCRDCRSVVLTENGHRPSRVLHRFNIVGELVESEIVE